MSCKVFRFNRLISYPEALTLQQNLVNQKLLNRTSEPDYLILLEHEPCVTLGRRCHSESINSSYPIFKSPRGGKVTFHGPGQITCYPIVDLKRQPKLSLECYVKNLANVMNEVLSKAYNLNGLYYDNDPERVGLWLPLPSNKKIGFIGIQAQKWITSHGFSINIKRESLKGFKEIDPCGLLNQNVKVTCVEDNTGTEINNYELVYDMIIDSFTIRRLREELRR